LTGLCHPNPGQARLLVLAIAVLAPLGDGAGLRAADHGPYRDLDRHAIQAPREAERSIESLAKYLVKPAKTDRQKARVIYRWVTDRIAYDVDAFFANRPGDNSAEGVLQSRKSVCEGSANLFLALCKEAGVEAVRVSGRAKGFGVPAGDGPIGRDSHAWNAVRFEDKWWLVDATWGAGAIKDRKFVKEFNDYYFLTPPDQLIFSHFPTDPKWQLLSEALSAKEWEEQPRADHQLFRMGVTGASVRKATQQKGFRDLVKTYAHPGDPVTVLSAPLERQLKVGTTYRFRIKPGSFRGIAVHYEGRWHQFVRRGDVFEGVVVAQRGPLKIMGAVPGDRPGQTRYWSFLEYVGE
jgi:hypothetical protein